MMRKTKIVCTIGPATDDDDIMRRIMQAGMNVARFNFSHGDYETHQKRYEQVVRLREELGLPIATLMDTRGPEIRLGKFVDDKPVTIHDGDTYVLTTEDVLCTAERGSVSFKNLPHDVKPGTHILINDGVIEMVVNRVNSTEITCLVIHGGVLSNNKGINVPGVTLSMPYLSEKDRNDLEFGAKMGFDFIAASFVSTSADIDYLRKYTHSLGWFNVRIIAKIENLEGVKNIDEILESADGIMVARGDLGVEIPFEQIPAVQKELIRKGYQAGKQVITATQMLESMITNSRPTRAEITDVANAIYDGTDAIMLSGETAAGKYPIEAVTMMGEIAEQTERYLKFEDYRDGKALEGKLNVSAAVGSAAVSMVEHIKAACIVTPTMSGQTARLISNLRPSVPIYGVTPYEWARRKMQLYWGVRPVTGYEEDSTENIISHAMYMVRREELVERGDMVIFTAGDPATNEVTGEGYMTNMLHIIQAK